MVHATTCISEVLNTHWHLQVLHESLGLTLFSQLYHSRCTDTECSIRTRPTILLLVKKNPNISTSKWPKIRSTDAHTSSEADLHLNPVTTAQHSRNRGGKPKYRCHPPTLDPSNARVRKIGRADVRSSQFETQNSALTQLISCADASGNTRRKNP